SDDTINLAGIHEAVLGDGHFLGGPATIAAMERDYVYPSLADRETPKTWEDTGALTAWDRASARVDDILANHHPSYIDDATDTAIRAAFDIRHP
ncbi:MAG: trimethylamine methyltransferase family protein, partial [Pseudomonadota bacterium]